MVKPEELEKELKKGTIRPAYLLAGEEPLLRDDALAAIRARVLSGTADDFNLDRLDGSTATPAALQDSVRNLPVMAEHRLVILVEPEAKRGGGKALADALADLLPELCQQESTVLVVTAAKPDKRGRWAKAFAKSGVVVDCDPPKQARSVQAFVKREAKRQGFDLEAGAAELLTERIGPQLLMLRHEIEKASLLAGPGEAITRAHVEASSTQLAEQPIWDLTDAIGEGRVADSLALLSRLLAAGAAPQQLLATLATHFRKLARVGYGGTVSGPPFLVRKLERQARRYNRRRLLTCLREIQSADTALKGVGSLPETLVMERLLLELAG